MFARRLNWLAGFACVYALVSCHAQKLTLDRPQTKNLVSYIAEPVTVEAGKPADVELNFRVVDALHINSHSPFATEMIPTTLSLQPVVGVKLGKMQYPAGDKYAFSFAPHEKLSVYSGSFVVKVSVSVAKPGSYALKGLLDYQACDNLQCYPVKTLPINVIATAK